MKEKIKKIVLGYLPGFITGVIVFSGVSVIAMTYFPSSSTTYDNTNSGLESTDVQGAIDELYNTCFPPTPAGDQILDDVDIVTSGDGLYKDSYEDGRYFYKGKNPNNYVTFNNENAGWRIISIEADGTIKIMRDADINISNNLSWDSSSSNNWARPSTLNTYLNGTYLNSLNSTAQGQIAAKDFSIGAINPYKGDLQTTINDENSKKWNGKIALVTASEYVRSNSNQSSCVTVGQIYNPLNSPCKGTTWMYYSGNYWWTLSPISDNSYGVLHVNLNADFYYYNVSSTDHAVRPALYLSSEVQITGGDGSQSNPYTLE